MKQLLNSPLPLPSKKSIVLETAFLMGYTLFVLLLFQPFGTHEYEHPYKKMQLLGYGLLVLVFYPAIRGGLMLLPASNHSIKKEALLLLASFMLLIVLGFFYHAAV